MSFAERIRSLLARVTILARRLRLDTSGVHATVPMLRGVWGAALHDLDLDVYRTVFDPCDSRSPGYILRPAPPDPHFAPALDWILIGDATRHDAALNRAWDIAAGMGIGSERRRFHIRRVVALGPTGLPAENNRSWSLGDATWPRPDLGHACRLCFPAPLRMQRDGRLIEHPSLPDLVVAACRRIRCFLPVDQHESWDHVARKALEHSREVPARPWQGERLDLHRYSGRQKAELEMHGVSGYLELPDGSGALRPLLAASQWVHLGKGTVMGLGQLVVQPIEASVFEPARAAMRSPLRRRPRALWKRLRAPRR